SLRDSLIGSTFGSLLRRYAGMDLLEDKIDARGKEIDPVAQYLEGLAEEAIQSPALLAEELHWLVTDEAKNGFRFGYALGKKDELHTLWSPIIDAWRNAGEKAHDF